MLWAWCKPSKWLKIIFSFCIDSPGLREHEGEDIGKWTKRNVLFSTRFPIYLWSLTVFIITIALAQNVFFFLKTIQVFTLSHFLFSLTTRGS